MKKKPSRPAKKVPRGQLAASTSVVSDEDCKLQCRRMAKELRELYWRRGDAEALRVALVRALCCGGVGNKLHKKVHAVLGEANVAVQQVDDDIKNLIASIE